VRGDGRAFSRVALGSATCVPATTRSGAVAPIACAMDKSGSEFVLVDEPAEEVAAADRAGAADRWCRARRRETRRRCGRPRL